MATIALLSGALPPMAIETYGFGHMLGLGVSRVAMTLPALNLKRFVQTVIHINIAEASIVEQVLVAVDAVLDTEFRLTSFAGLHVRFLRRPAAKISPQGF